MFDVTHGLRTDGHAPEDLKQKLNVIHMHTVKIIEQVWEFD